MLVSDHAINCLSSCVCRSSFVICFVRVRSAGYFDVKDSRLTGTIPTELRMFDRGKFI